MFQNVLRKVTYYRLPILSGFLVGTSYIPLPPWALFFALVPLFYFWASPSLGRKQALIGGWITQFILNLVGFHWIAYTAVEFGHFPWWVGGLALLAFAAIAHLYYPLTGLIMAAITARFRLQTGPLIFAFSTLFLLIESLWPSIFPWHLGYPWLWAGLPGAQFADVIGFEGLNVVTVSVNAALAWSLVVWRERGEVRRAGLIAGLAVLGLATLNLFGMGRSEPWRRTDSRLNVLAVQGNIGNFDKLLAERGKHFRAPVIAKYMELSRQGLRKHPNTQIMIWPETAFPDYLDVPYQSGDNALLIRKFARDLGTPLLTGSYSHNPKTDTTYNGFFYIDRDGNLPIPPYRKSILLVFGETFPFSEYIPYMETLFPDMGAFGRGQGPQVMTLPFDRSASEASGPVKIGPQICYEGLYPWFTAALAAQGAQILTNVTNDSWFGRHFEPYQHLYMTMARTIEFRRPLIRSTNTGITTVVLATGELLQPSPMHREWTGFYEVQYLSRPPHTFYEKIVGLWPWMLAISLALLIGFGRERQTA